MINFVAHCFHCWIMKHQRAQNIATVFAKRHPFSFFVLFLGEEKLCWRRLCCSGSLQLALILFGLLLYPHLPESPTPHHRVARETRNHGNKEQDNLSLWKEVLSMQNPFNVYTRQVGLSLLFFRGKRHGSFSKYRETQLMLSFYQAWPPMEGRPHIMQQDLHLHQWSPCAWDLAAPPLTASQIGIQFLILLLCYRAGILSLLNIESLGTGGLGSAFQMKSQLSISLALES